VACDHFGAGAWVEGWDAGVLVNELYQGGFGGWCTACKRGWQAADAQPVCSWGAVCGAGVVVVMVRHRGLGVGKLGLWVTATLVFWAYLDKRESFIKWVHFMHNQINLRLNRDEVSLQEAVNAYYSNYKPKQVRLHEEFKYRRKLMYAGMAVAAGTGLYYLYYK